MDYWQQKLAKRAFFLPIIQEIAVLGIPAVLLANLRTGPRVCNEERDFEIMGFEHVKL